MFLISCVLTIESNVHGCLQTHTSAVLQEMCKTNVVHKKLCNINITFITLNQSITIFCSFGENYQINSL